jgi:hypothetical protein
MKGFCKAILRDFGWKIHISTSRRKNFRSRLYFLQLFEGDIFCKNDPRRDPFIFKKHAGKLSVYAPNSYTRTALHPGKIA